MTKNIKVKMMKQEEMFCPASPFIKKNKQSPRLGLKIISIKDRIEAQKVKNPEVLNLRSYSRTNQKPPKQRETKGKESEGKKRKGEGELFSFKLITQSQFLSPFLPKNKGISPFLSSNCNSYYHQRLLYDGV